MSELDGLKKLSDVVNVIKGNVGRLVGGNVAVAIVDSTAIIKYIDNEIVDFTDFIISFTKGNFDLLSIGDHSLPLSGTNIAFFKVSEKTLVILNSSKGPVGQLLAFKGQMNNYSAKIDELLESISEVEEKVPAKAAVRVPVLTVSISNKKFGMEEAKVLHLVNGQNTITDICARTRLPQLKVDEILRKYQKKKWIKLKRLIIGEKPAPTAPKKTVVKPTREPTTPSPKGVSVVERAGSVYVFPIFEGVFKPKKFPKQDAIVLKLCDGQYTLDDIIQETSINRIKLMEIIKKYEKKGKLKLTKIVPSKPTVEMRPPEPAVIQEAPAVAAPSIPAIPSPPIEPVQEEVVFDELMEIMNQTQPVETQQVVPQPAPPVYQPPPPVTAAMPSSPALPNPPAPVIPQPVAPTAPAVPESPRVPTPPGGNAEMSQVQAEPVSDGLFDDLTNLLEDTAPMASAPAPVAPPPVMPAPATPAPPVTPVAPETVSSNALLEETDEGIKITTYAEENPLQNRLDRLSTILEETGDETTPKEETNDVQIIGSKAVCPNCKTHVIMMAKVCPNCNRALRTCPDCKSPITLFARICPSCGSLL